MTSVFIVDYDHGNLFSGAQAFRHCGADVNSITTPQEIENSDHLVLLGVGAFGDAMGEINKRRLSKDLRDWSSPIELVHLYS